MAILSTTRMIKRFTVADDLKESSKITQIVDVENLWEAYSNVGMDVVEIKHVESDKVLQTVKTDMVKHDVEVESSGECVEEIDRVERRSVEADQRWKYARHYVHIIE
ncbi:hypothetical protein Tco_0382738 [Tanacetum coccineum]